MFDIPKKMCRKCEKELENFYFHKTSYTCIECTKKGKRLTDLEKMRKNESLKGDFR